MYVDVVACRRGRVKVDITLAKRSYGDTVPSVVTLPVRKSVSEPEQSARIKVPVSIPQWSETSYRRITAVAVPREPEETITEPEYLYIEPAYVEPELVESDVLPDDLDVIDLSVLCTPAEADDDLEVQLVEMAEDEPEDDADEAALWTAAAYDPAKSAEEEENERMASESITAIDEMLAGAGAETAEEVFVDVVADALDELDDMSRRADVMMERLDGQLAAELEQISDSADEDSQVLSSIIDKELETLDSVLIQRDDTADTAAGVRIEGGSVMHFFDRDSRGEWVRDSQDSGATGQKVICYDEESGKLSRICGIIRSDSDRSGSVSEDDQDNE